MEVQLIFPANQIPNSVVLQDSIIIYLYFM